MTAKPPGQTTSRSNPSFEIKSAQLSLIALLLKSSRWGEIAADVCSHFGEAGESPDFFDKDLVVLDFSALKPDAQWRDITGLLQALRSCKLLPLAFRAEPDGWAEQLIKAGLVSAAQEIRKVVAKPVQPAQEILREVPGPLTMVIDKPVRSGQKVYARGADLVVLAMVNQGAEVVADGNIHVYAPLRGKAIAGAHGNTAARIFSMCMEPELISIAGVYRTGENPLPIGVAGKPAQVRLSSKGGQDRLLIESLKN